MRALKGMTNVMPAIYPLLTHASAGADECNAADIAGNATLAMNILMRSRKKPIRNTMATLLR
ncbi:hypothetical protein D3C71_1251610 [compost metagenome]